MKQLESRLKRLENKFNARKTVVDGITFASKKESNRYRELKMLERAGEICCLRLQVPFELIPAQYEETGEVYTKGANKGKPKRGKCIEKAVTYIADFVYYNSDATVRTVEDVKGMRTPVYIIKRKLFRWRYPDYEFREV